MTAQVSDKFYYNDKEYTLVTISEKIKFHPKDYGIIPQMIHTACYRGFHCDYVIKNEILYLNNFTVNSANGNYPEINGKKPIPDSWFVEICKERGQDFTGPCEYKDLELPIEFTGRIVLGDGFIKKYYIHMGFQRAWAYEELIELEIEDGLVVNLINHSEKAKSFREAIEEDEVGFNKKLKENIPQFVEESFSLEMRDKAWWI